MKYILTCLLACTTLLSNAQSSFTVGAGMSTQWFIHHNIAFESSIFQPKAVTKPNLELGVVLNTQNRFQLQSNLVFQQQSITRAVQFNLAGGGRAYEGFAFDFISLNIGLMGRYELPIKSSKLYPTLGFFGAFNQYIGNGYFSRVSGFRGNGVINNQNTTLTFDIFVMEQRAYYGAGTITGLSYEPKINRLKYPIELYGLCYFSPIVYFDAPFEFQLNNEPTEMQGWFQYVTTGLRMKF